MAAYLLSLQEGQEIGPYGCIFVHRVVSLDKHPRAWFICPYCGNGFLTRIDVVKSGGTRSCGCYQRKQARIQLRKNIDNMTEAQKKEQLQRITKVGQNNSIDITGKTFGNLKVIEKTQERAADRSIIWKCFCSCSDSAFCPAKEKNDRFFYVSTADLLSGHITKNSLCHCSSGERAVIDFLNCHKINYIFQYRDKRCINPKTKKILPFDFFLPEYKVLIEYDGRQHEFTTPHGFYNKEYLVGVKERDNIKNQWADKIGYTLIRIRQEEHQKLGSQIFEQKILPLLKKEEE